MLVLQVGLALLPLVLCLPPFQQRLENDLSWTHNSEVSSDRDANTVGSLKIAIIGSGIVGASAAYTLAENARQNSRAPPISITMFEQNAIIGGRITTTNVFDDEELAIDTCAATFNARQDTCVASLAREVGVTQSTVTALDNGTAVWNGKEIVGLIEADGFRDINTWSNFKRAKFQLRYGSTPFIAGNLLQSSYMTLGSLVFRSLTDEVNRAGRLNLSLTSGACEGTDALCVGQPEDRAYLREVIEAGVRDRFFGDYDEVNELNSALGLTDQKSLISIFGGNLRLVERLIRLSGATLRVNTQVKSVASAGKAKWNIGSQRSDRENIDVDTFDRVIIATPLSTSSLQYLGEPLGVPQVRFADSVVTHFTTKWDLSAEFFGTGLPVPQNILTSATATEDGNRADLPFFSLRLLDNSIQPINSSDPDATQKLYKIVSHRNISVAEISQYLVPTNADAARTPSIMWMNRKYLPKSVPRLDRAVKIQGEIEIQPGLFYAGGGAQVTDTVEFGCRMGRNAARLIVNDPIRVQPGNG